MNRSVPTPGTNYAAKLNPTTQTSDQVSNYCMCRDVHSGKLSVFRVGCSLPRSFVPWASKDDLRIFRGQNWSGRITTSSLQYDKVRQPPLRSVTYIAIHGESPSEHECRVAFPGCLKAQHKAELLSGLPKDCLRGGISSASNTTQLKTDSRN